MTEGAHATYTLRTVEKMLGIGRGAVAGLIEAGFVAPTRGARNEYRFSFQDVVLLRTAHELRSARVPSRRVLGSLRELRAKLPASMPISGLRIKAVGGEVAVRSADARWEAATTGQLLLDFEVAGADGQVTFIQRRVAEVAGAGAGAGPQSAQAWFGQGVDREDAGQADEAAEAYRQALALAPGHVHAAVNLGALLCEAGRCEEALQLYDAAVRQAPEATSLHFNRAIALEDQQRTREALQAYLTCLALDPLFADAHFNAARLYEALGETHGAVRHLNAYRRLRAG